MNLAQAANAFDRFGSRLLQNVGEAEVEAIGLAYEEAIALSSGTLSYPEMEALDHPYATRHGGSRIPGDPAIINAHTSEFRDAWSADAHDFMTGTDISARLVNMSRVAEWLRDGTPTMEARPIDERIVERVQPQRELLLIAAVEEAAP